MKTTTQKRISVYLSKNNNADPETLSLLRSYLAAFSELREYTSGVYSFSIMDKADIVVVVPPKGHYINSDDPDWVLNGKGSGSEAAYALKNKKKVFVAFVPPNKKPSQSNIAFHEITEVHEYDKQDWQYSYYSMNILNDNIDLGALLDDLSETRFEKFMRYPESPDNCIKPVKLNPKLLM